MKQIIAFTGRQKNGKSTICDFIHTEMITRGIPTVRVNFKDPLLQMARYIGWNGEKDEKGRRLLQLLGTDIVRECIDPDYWVKAWKKSVTGEAWKRVANGAMIGNVVLTDDVRFDNEAEAVRELGGKVIFVETPEVGKLDTHKSEHGISPKLIDRSFEGISFGLTHLRTIANVVIAEYIVN